MAMARARARSRGRGGNGCHNPAGALYTTPSLN